MTSLDDILAEADATLLALVGRLVEYRRGESRVSWFAAVGSTQFEVSTEYGLESYESRDYIGLAADLILDDGTEEVAITPQQGDRIYDSRTSFVYEVSAPQGQPCFKYSDPNRTVVRVHTKCIGES
jgi:hypothetical protein